MARLAFMKLGKESQISYRSTPDIVAKLDLVTATLASRRVTFAGKKLRTGHVVNAVALWLSTLAPDDLVGEMESKLGALATYLDDDKPPAQHEAEARREAAAKTAKKRNEPKPQPNVRPGSSSVTSFGEREAGSKNKAPKRSGVPES